MISSLNSVVSFKLFLGEKLWHSIDFHWNQKFLKNHNCQNQLMFLQGVIWGNLTLLVGEMVLSWEQQGLARPKFHQGFVLIWEPFQEIVLKTIPTMQNPPCRNPKGVCPSLKCPSCWTFHTKIILVGEPTHTNIAKSPYGRPKFPRW